MKNSKHSKKSLISNIIIFCFLILLSCKTSEEKKDCYCEKVYDRKINDTTREVLCYKQSNVFKLIIRNSDKEVLSRHNLNNPNYSYESVTHVNGLERLEKSDFIKVIKYTDSVSFEIIGVKCDSVYLSIDKDKSLNLFKTKFNGNKFVLPKIFIEPFLDNNITIKTFWINRNISELIKFNDELRNLVLKGDTPVVTSSNTYPYSAFRDLIEYNLDSVYANIKKCYKK